MCVYAAWFCPELMSHLKHENESLWTNWAQTAQSTKYSLFFQRELCQKGLCLYPLKYQEELCGIIAQWTVPMNYHNLFWENNACILPTSQYSSAIFQWDKLHSLTTVSPPPHRTYSSICANQCTSICCWIPGVWGGFFSRFLFLFSVLSKTRYSHSLMLSTLPLWPNNFRVNACIPSLMYPMKVDPTSLKWIW